MNLREAAQQALEAFDKHATWHEKGCVYLDPAIDALRAALSEEAMQRLTDVQQEMEPHVLPVAYLCKHTGWFRKTEDADAAFKVDAMPLYALPPKDATKIVEEYDPDSRTISAYLVHDNVKVEPVAWMVYTLDGQSVCVTDNPADFTDQHRAFPLYTSPPKLEWVGLTDEEMEQICDENYIMLGAYAADFIRAIEAKLKEKNHG